MTSLYKKKSHFQHVVAQAKACLKRGWCVIPLRRKSKMPRDAGWPDQRVTEDEIETVFSGGANIGVVLGETSGCLADVDLDSPEAVRAAKKFLPETGRIHGRTSKRQSHWFYCINDSIAPEKFLDPVDRKVLVEIRSDGQQTAIPPSIHPSGERFYWVRKEAPAKVDARILRSSVKQLAACALAAKHWPKEGARHDSALALSGGLLRSGWSAEDARGFVERVARVAGDEEWRERGEDVLSTAKRFSSGGAVTGIPSLAKLLDESIVEKLRDWLELSPSFEVVPSHEAVGSTVNWPDPPGREAFDGLAGEIVAALEPHTEADPVALLVQTLAVFGNIVGRQPHFTAEGDRHGTNIFPVMVGVTSKGRKGSSWSQVNRVFQDVDGEWASGSVQSGLSSGEGLIWAVRDRIERTDPVRKKGRVIGYQSVIADPGVDDKRLLDLETEFAAVLRIIGREGSTLSATIRQAWDSGRILTKNSPAKATGAHISIIGHVTRDELRRYLDTSEVGNGFANRFLWTCVRRSKILPEGGGLRGDDLGPIVNGLRASVKSAREVHEMRRGNKARNLWLEIYPELSEGRPGLLGAVTSRAEAQVMRLACIYALMDRSKIVRVQNLRAALALWKYCESSARYIFGDSLGDPVADTLLKALRNSANGLTRTDIRDLFGRNRGAHEIDRALRVLLEYGHVRKGREEAEQGRPTERWFALAALQAEKVAKEKNK